MADIVAEAEIEASYDDVNDEVEADKNDANGTKQVNGTETEVLPAKNLHVRNLSYLVASKTQ